MAFNYRSVISKCTCLLCKLSYDHRLKPYALQQLFTKDIVEKIKVCEFRLPGNGDLFMFSYITTSDSAKILLKSTSLEICLVKEFWGNQKMLGSFTEECTQCRSGTTFLGGKNAFSDSTKPQKAKLCILQRTIKANFKETLKLCLESLVQSRKKWLSFLVVRLLTFYGSAFYLLIRLQDCSTH